MYLLNIVIVLATLLIADVVSGRGINGEDISIDMMISQHMAQQEYIRSIVDYWTPERMASAKPMLPMVVNVSKANWGPVQQQDGPEQSLPSMISTLEEVSRSSSIPSTVGKVFFVKNGKNYSCSGSVVVALNRDMVSTAGHCIFDYDTKTWASNLIFVPKYTSGSRPFGSWVWREMVSMKGWTDYKDYNYDVGFVLLYTNANKEHVQQYTGALGMTKNWKKEAWINAFGYSKNMNGGETMSTCAATSTSDVGNASNFYGIKLSCGMTGGSSGGPFIQQHDTTTRLGYQVSVISFTVENQPGYIYGPYFNDDVWNLYKKYESH